MAHKEEELGSTTAKSIFPVLLVLHALVFLHTPQVDGARILGLFASPAPSHNMMFQALMKALAEGGHVVEVASPCPLPTAPHKNYKDIKLPVPDFDRGTLLKMLISPDHGPVKEHIILWSVSKVLCETHLASPELQKYLSQDPGSFNFDLIVVEVFFYDCLIGFHHRFNVPVIAMASQFSLPWVYDLVGNPHSYSHVPHILLPYGENMNFFERLHNAIFSLGVTFARRWLAMPPQNEIAQKYIGSEMPPLWELERNISLVFTNGHPATSPIHPLMPNMIEVAGMHISEKPPPLPKELQKLMDAHSRVILFSFGSIIVSDTIPRDRLETLLVSFKKLDVTIIWKWDGDVDELPLPLPSHVHIFKWLPQQSLLAHHNMAGFVTHGGLLSLQEATYYGIPVIGFPFFGDQFMNLRHITDVGMGQTLNFHSFTSDDLVMSVQDILHNASYWNTAKKQSAIFRDQPETPLQRGIYWTEYVIRHKGAPHLRSAAMDLNWLQYQLIDVIAFVLFVAGMILGIIYYAFITLVTLLSSKKTIEKREKKIK
ncbi:UDP-glycosyltransferase UGT5-like [Hetaerina americana]|uniref:UDP-glycosyltransferase UGT5-like n=1 Tax=Hetaerina americana TaxID=62018 RepID=UPI003A7F4AB0